MVETKEKTMGKTKLTNDAVKKINKNKGMKYNFLLLLLLL